MTIGNLTPRSNSKVSQMNFSGGFGQPDGFGEILEVSINTAGDLCLTIKKNDGSMWSVTLTNEQRNTLAGFIGQYQPRLYERII